MRLLSKPLQDALKGIIQNGYKLDVQYDDSFGLEISKDGESWLIELGAIAILGGEPFDIANLTPHTGNQSVATFLSAMFGKELKLPEDSANMLDLGYNLCRS